MAALGTMGWRAFGAPARQQRGYGDTTWWDPYVENITDTDTYLRRKFRQDVTDKTTGLDVPGLKKRLAEIVAAGKASGEPWRITKPRHLHLEPQRPSDQRRAGWPRRRSERPTAARLGEEGMARGQP